MTVPLIPASELAVISLNSVSFERNFKPKMPRELIEIVPPLPWVALAVMSLFSFGTVTINPPLNSTVPPAPGA